MQLVSFAKIFIRIGKAEGQGGVTTRKRPQKTVLIGNVFDDVIGLTIQQLAKGFDIFPRDRFSLS